MFKHFLLIFPIHNFIFFKNVSINNLERRKCLVYLHPDKKRKGFENDQSLRKVEVLRGKKFRVLKRTKKQKK